MKKTLLAAALALAAMPNVFADDLYTPLEGDYDISVYELSGRFVNDGFSLAFIGVPLDADGFTCGEGDLVNLSIYTESPSDPDFHFARTYKYYDTEAYMNDKTLPKWGPGDMMGGMMYEIMSGYFAPMGSFVETFDEEGVESALGLVGEGSTVTVTYKGQGIFNFYFDFVTREGAKATGEWEGVAANFIKDCPDLEPTSGIESIEANQSGAEYYSMQGVRLLNPQPGTMCIRLSEGKASKVLVK